MAVQSYIATTLTSFSATSGSVSGALTVGGFNVITTNNVFSTGAAGIVPASGGGTTNYLRADGTWAAPTGGTGATLSANNTFTGTNTFNNTFTISQAFFNKNSTFFALSGTSTNDVALTSMSTSSIYRMSLWFSGDNTITGIAGGSDGQYTTLVNTSNTLKLILAGNSSSSTSGNRFQFVGNVVLEPQESVTLWYNNNSVGSLPAGWALASSTKLDIKQRLTIQVADTLPSTTDQIDIFSRNVAGRGMVRVYDQDYGYFLQPSLTNVNMIMFVPGSGTFTSGTAVKSVGDFTPRFTGTGATITYPAPTSSSRSSSLAGAACSTGTTTTGASGIQSTLPFVWRGSSANLGGFLFNCRFSVTSGYLSTMRIMIGVSASNVQIAGEPSAINDSFFVGKDSTDTNWQIIARNTSTATKTTTSTAPASATVYDLYIYCKPNDSKITTTLIDSGILNTTGGGGIDSNAIINNVQSTATLPTNTTFLYGHFQIMSTVGTTAKICTLHKMYIESY